MAVIKAYVHKINRAKSSATGTLNPIGLDRYPQQMPFRAIPSPDELIQRGDTVEAEVDSKGIVTRILRKLPRTE